MRRRQLTLRFGFGFHCTARGGWRCPPSRPGSLMGGRFEDPGIPALQSSVGTLPGRVKDGLHRDAENVRETTDFSKPPCRLSPYPRGRFRNLPPPVRHGQKQTSDICKRVRRRICRQSPGGIGSPQPPQFLRRCLYVIHTIQNRTCAGAGVSPFRSGSHLPSYTARYGVHWKPDWFVFPKRGLAGARGSAVTGRGGFGFFFPPGKRQLFRRRRCSVFLRAWGTT